MPDSNNPRELFKDAMTLFQNKEYLDAGEKFASVLDIDLGADKTLPSNCSIRSVLYFELSSAAASGNRKNLNNILDITHDDADFNGLQTVYLKQFMADFKNIMESVFEYNKHEGLYGDIVSWYNGITGEKLRNSKDVLVL